MQGMETGRMWPCLDLDRIAARVSTVAICGTRPITVKHGWPVPPLSRDGTPLPCQAADNMRPPLF